MNVESLLEAAGYGPRLLNRDFSAAVQLADCVADTIGLTVKRALFVAKAADEIAQLDAERKLEGCREDALMWVSWLEGQRSTPTGSLEVWGSFTCGYYPPEE